MVAGFYLIMQTQINLWLWKYLSASKRYGGYHLRADEAACRLLISRLDHPDFSKASFGLRSVPTGMPLILAPATVGFHGFNRLRLRIDLEEPVDIAFEENDGYLDLYLNDAGRLRLLEDMTEMLNGEWDYSGIGGIWYWGLLSAEQYSQYYPAA
jgi:hypothetical protein